MLEEDIRKTAKNALEKLNNETSCDLNLKLKHIEKLQRFVNLSDKEYNNGVINNDPKMLDMYRDLIKALSFYIKIEKDKIMKNNKI